MTFTILSAGSLVLDLFVFHNPDQGINVFLTGLFSGLFLLSTVIDEKVGQVAQSCLLAIASFFPLLSQDSFFFGGAIAAMTLILIYAYGGYRQFGFWKFPLTVALLFGLCLAASSMSTTIPFMESVLRAGAWTFFIVVFCLILYFVMTDLEHRFHSEFASDLITQNRKLLELNKELSGGCEDAHNP